MLRKKLKHLFLTGSMSGKSERGRQRYINNSSVKLQLLLPMTCMTVKHRKRLLMRQSMSGPERIQDDYGLEQQQRANFPLDFHAHLHVLSPRIITLMWKILKLSKKLNNFTKIELFVAENRQETLKCNKNRCALKQSPENVMAVSRRKVS